MNWNKFNGLTVENVFVAGHAQKHVLLPIRSLP